jgi:ribosomal protein L24
LHSDSPVSIETMPIKSGDKVRVIRGKLQGLEGEVIDFNSGKTELIVRLDILGCAKLMIETVNLHKVS